MRAVHDRIDEISMEQPSLVKYNSKVEFKRDIDIREAIRHWKQEHDNGDEVIYLSPDATKTLSSTSRPPSVVVIGMLIDRRITSDRSRKRAEESLHLQALKLPLDELKVKGISSEEPLNVDTIMELMQRWWMSCDRLEEQLDTSVNNKNASDRASKYRKCFVEAAAWAMKSHRERHPNRTVHKS